MITKNLMDEMTSAKPASKLFELINYVPDAYDNINFLSYIQSSEFRENLFLGYLESHCRHNTANINDNSHSLFLGSMGSGKSYKLNLSLLTWLVNNMDRTLVFFNDTITGCHDLRAYFDSPNCMASLDSEGFLFTIDVFYKEMIARKNEFIKKGYISINSYEKEHGSLTRLVMVVEQFHMVSQYDLNFLANYSNPNTYAHKFYEILKYGKQYGLIFMGSSQRASLSDVPPKILEMIDNKILSRSSAAESVYLLGNDKASKISISDKKRAECQNGSIIYPSAYDDIDTRFILNYFYKPLISHPLTFTHDSFLNYKIGKK